MCALRDGAGQRALDLGAFRLDLGKVSQQDQEDIVMQFARSDGENLYVHHLRRKKTLNCDE